VESASGRESRSRSRSASSFTSIGSKVLGFAEIGKILDISEGAAKLRAFRAYEELRRRLGDLVEEGSP